MKFTIFVLGCQMNYADASRIKAVLRNCGFAYTDDMAAADIVIFDTCSIKQKSEDKITGKLKEIPKDKKIWITGCMVQHNFRSNKLKGSNMKVGNFLGNVLVDRPEIMGLKNDDLEHFDARNKDDIHNFVFVNNAFNPVFHELNKTYSNVELFFRIDDVGFLPLMMKEVGYDIKYDRELINEYSKIIPDGAVNMDSNPRTAFVPISTGCNQFCSYCIVPYARGLEKYFEVEQIMAEVDYHLKNGVEEIVLLGQIVNKHPKFLEIIKEIIEKSEVKRLRYTSPYPTYYSDELLALHEKEPKLCPHIHIPLQSGSDTVLKRMFRGYTAQQFKDFINKIKGLKRKISLTTDIIVGFPDETKEDFQQTLDLVQYCGFDMIYIGIYSSRPGTYADNTFPDTISKEEKRTRRDELNELLNDISDGNNALEIGLEKEILVNKVTEKDIQGYTDDMKTVIIKIEELKNGKMEKGLEILKERYFGKFINVKITKAIPFKLYGEIVE